jgi:hypothetical protein
MVRCGIRGINKILITGRVLLNGIPIGAPTNIVSAITGIFTISTIVARVEVGIKDSMVFVHPQPLDLSIHPQPPVRRFALLKLQVRRFALLKLLVRRFALLSLLVRRFTLLKLLVRRSTPLKPLVLAAKNR